MHALFPDLPLVADLGADGEVSWIEPDGTPVRVIHGALPDRADDPRDLSKPIGRVVPSPDADPLRTR